MEPQIALAQALATLDGYIGADVPQSYQREAQDLIEALEGAGWSLHLSELEDG